MNSWLSIPQESCFSLAKIPFGIISTLNDQSRRPAVAIGDYALDIRTFANNGGFDGLKDFPVEKLRFFSDETLNSFANLGRPLHRAVRNYLRDLFRHDTPFPGILKDNLTLRQLVLIPLSNVEMHYP